MLTQGASEGAGEPAARNDSLGAMLRAGKSHFRDLPAWLGAGGPIGRQGRSVETPRSWSVTIKDNLCLCHQCILPTQGQHPPPRLCRWLLGAAAAHEVSSPHGSPGR